MNFKGIYYSLTFRLALAIGLTAALTYQALEKEWGWFLFCLLYTSDAADE